MGRVRDKELEADLVTWLNGSNAPQDIQDSGFTFVDSGTRIDSKHTRIEVTVLEDDRLETSVGLIGSVTYQARMLSRGLVADVTDLGEYLFDAFSEKDVALGSATMSAGFVTTRVGIPARNLSSVTTTFEATIGG